MKFCYIVANAFRHITRHKMISIIVCLCVAIGMIMPMYSVFNCNAILREYAASKYADEEKTTMISVFDKYLDEGAILKRYEDLLPEVQKMGIGAIISTTVSMPNGAKSAVNLLGATQDLLNTDGYTLVSGRVPTKQEYESGANVAVLRQNGTQENFLQQNNVRIGDKLNVQGTEYTIIGSIAYPRMMGNILVPYNAMANLAENKKLQHWGNFVTETASQPKVLEEKIKQLDEVGVLFVGSGTEVLGMIRESYAQTLKAQLISAFMVLAFAVIGFALIMLSKSLSMRYIIGVKMAVGASKTQIFIEMLIENFTLILAALVIDTFALMLAARLIPSLGILIDIRTLAIGVGITMLLSLIIAMCSHIAIAHRPMAGA